VAPPVVPAGADAGRKRLSYKEKRELEELELRIAAQEERKAALEQQLVEQGSDHLLVAQLYAESQQLEADLERDMTRWTELAERDS